MQTRIAAPLVLALCAVAQAQVTSTTTHGANADSLDAQILVGDLLSGLIPTELPADQGWHPANPAAVNGSLDPNGLPAFTNDVGGGGLSGLLNDFPGAGSPTKSIEYDLGGATDVTRIHILTGNAGKDGRVFSTTVVRFSTNDAGSFSTLGYFQSDPSGTTNPGTWGSTLVEIFDASGGALASGVTHLQFDFFAVDNTAGVMRDPFDDVNPFTGVDDGLSSAIVAPLIFEIDVIPGPATGASLGLLGLGAVRRRRR